MFAALRAIQKKSADSFIARSRIYFPVTSSFRCLRSWCVFVSARPLPIKLDEVPVRNVENSPSRQVVSRNQTRAAAVFGVSNGNTETGYSTTRTD